MSYSKKPLTEEQAAKKLRDTKRWEEKLYKSRLMEERTHDVDPPTCPFCRRRDKTCWQSHGDWPVLDCRRCGLRIELVLVEEIPTN